MVIMTLTEAAMARQTSSKTFRLTSLATVLTLAILSFSAFAADNADQGYLNFLNALGEPALIGANADHELASSACRPLPAFGVAEIDADKLRLGFDLFHERRLSVDNSTGCNSCHSGMFGGTDGRRVSVGVNAALGALNAPTTFNAAYNFTQFWDGRAVDLKQQTLGPIENELEMAHSLNAVIDMLNTDSSYPTKFAMIYPDGISAHNMADALAYFQTINFSRGGTPFVQHLNGIKISSVIRRCGDGSVSMRSVVQAVITASIMVVSHTSNSGLPELIIVNTAPPGVMTTA